MADINKRLLTAQGDIPAPQHKKKGESNFEFTEGSHGAQHTKIVDAYGQPADIDAELKSIKRTQAEILDRLDNGIDTRLTGSIVEEIYLQQNETIIINPGETFRVLSHDFVKFESINEVIIVVQANLPENLEVRYYNTVYEGDGNLFRKDLTSEDALFGIFGNRMTFAEKLYTNRITVGLRNLADSQLEITQTSVLGRGVTSDKMA